MFHEGKQIGSYTLIKKLGRGGFGEVWLTDFSLTQAMRGLEDDDTTELYGSGFTSKLRPAVCLTNEIKP